jgi:prolyl-tRNA synthetase
MRTREFVMKDLYSFSRDDQEHEVFYAQAQEAYGRIFDRVGLGEWTYLTYASGGAFAKYSHEFQTITEAGEDTIYVHKEKKVAINAEVLNDEVMKELGVIRDELEEVKAAEVGNIFNLGTTKSEPLGLTFADEDGSQKPVVMGSYGLGPARIMGVIVERYADDNGLIWPEAIAPYKVHLVRLGSDDEVRKAADKLYAKLEEDGVEVLYDDRDDSAGTKFADADLLGLPVRLTVSKKTLAEDSVEVKKRGEEEFKLVKVDAARDLL